MKIALVTPGRFHAFDLAAALIRRGHDVTVFTNTPAFVARRFGLDPARVRTFTLHGAASRATAAVGSSHLSAFYEPIACSAFGRWSARMLARESWDVIHCWSGVSEEVLASPAASRALTLLMRGSSHIRTQRRLLDEESDRAGQPLDKPSDWMVARELREYSRVDRIAVLSTFAHQSFLDEGVPASRLRLLGLGVDVAAFRAPKDVSEARRQRIRSGQPLRVLYVGAVSYRKGLLDLSRAASALAGECAFTIVGKVLPEAEREIASLAGKVDVRGKVAHGDLPAVYQEADLFLFPTIEDGFGLVLAQAKAAALPVLTTAHSAGTDLIAEGQDGWILPIRRPDAIIERLRWCHDRREEVARMVGASATVPSRDWSDVAADFEGVCAARPFAAHAS